MRLGIDARWLEKRWSGVARYLITLLHQWGYEHLNHEYFLYFQSRPVTDTLVSHPHFISRLPGRIPIGKPNLRELLWEQVILPGALRKDRVDLFFSPGYTMPLAYRGPSVVTIHDVSYEAHPEWSQLPQRVKLRTISSRTARRASAILTDSNFSKGELIKYYALKPEKIKVIPLAADGKMRPLPRDQTRQVLAERYRIHDDYLLYVGSIFSRRHVPTLINAFRLVSRRLNRYQLVLVGSDCLRSSPGIRQIVDGINSEEGRDLIRYFEDVPDDDLPYLYNGASLFVYLSEYEGFGLPPLEALACGTPVVTSNLASLPEVLGDAAIIVADPTDESVVAHAILTGLADERLRLQLKARGLEQARKFSWERCARETMKVMEEVHSAC